MILLNFIVRKKTVLMKTGLVGVFSIESSLKTVYSMESQFCENKCLLNITIFLVFFLFFYYVLLIIGEHHTFTYTFWNSCINHMY